MALQWLLYPLAILCYDAIEPLFQEFSFFLFIISMGLVAAYCQLNFPETKNKSTLEILRLLGMKEKDERKISIVH